MVNTPQRLVFGNFELDTARRALLQHDTEIHLTPKEYLTLVSLVTQAGNAVSRETLLAKGWPETTVGDSSLARCISSLRKHLGADAIEAVPKFGYRFSLHVTASETPVPVAVLPRGPEADLPVVTTAQVSFWRTAAAARVAGAVTVFLLALGAAPMIRPRLASATPLTWMDPQTDLMWASRDNGADITRQHAIDYCHNLNLAGYRDWRLPSIDELQTLYDTGISTPGVWGPTRAVYWHVKGNLHLTGGETADNLTWLTEMTPAGMEQSFDFSYGRRNYDDVSFAADHRALCVRRGQ